MITEYDRYTLRQLVLPREYREKLENVKRRIRMLTGRNVSMETAMMCLIDEFINAHVPEEKVNIEQTAKGEHEQIVNHHLNTLVSQR